jgi:hypothetical protein
MAQPIEEIKAILKPWTLIELTSEGTSTFDGKVGYAGESFADSFEFLQVTNEFEHFSNASAEPKTRTHLILYTDVVSVKRYPF